KLLILLISTMQRVAILCTVRCNMCPSRTLPHTLLGAARGGTPSAEKLKNLPGPCRKWRYFSRFRRWRRRRERSVEESAFPVARRPFRCIFVASLISVACIFVACREGVACFGLPPWKKFLAA